MENLCSIYRFIYLLLCMYVLSLSPVPCLSWSIKRPGLPRMGLVTNGMPFSQTEIPNRKFPNFFVNGKHPMSTLVLLYESSRGVRDEFFWVMFL